ncbi:acetophenone carboxylase delta subunit [Variibacter gotjawalensis]|uniref:Acetophenone carboxylase delta subunit n=1 Tax=Variibacter gotjawalensis TaxID=1333996 RepID=A0A0S3PU82_9BRAD|nr:hydantoinase B/oxoprolinase family protein [Variibacter gotjawalensis]NIK49765.1 N-methylhydantoinase B [Variibacter gotjawalensis]RZS45770.1 N-methylhydantoinase B [Variibacter gotjawalensis]BAT59443.1 acetophenone carboxylase delta subunit [Variibacter gotjawalensis]
MDDISHSLEFAHAIDPIELQIIRQRLIAIPNVIEKNIERTAFSLLVQEYKDYAVGFVDATGSLVTQSRYSLPGFVANALGLAVRSGLDLIGADEMQEGDVFISNEAATLGKHLNDVCMFTPIRIDGHLLGFFAVLVHWVDVGGMMPGSCLSPTTTEVYQEGVQFPLLKLVNRGERRREIFRLIEVNTRFPRLVMGDLEAQLGGCQMGHDMVRQVVSQHGLAEVQAAMEAMHADAESSMARALQTLPHGTYTASSFFDDDGIKVGEPIKVDVKVIVDEDGLTIDLSDVNDQVSGPFNSGREGGAVAVGRMVAKFLFSSMSPVNEGDFERVKIVIPDGKFLSARPDAAYGSAGNTHASVVDTILSAFAEALPDRIPAGHHGIYGTHTITGVDERSGTRFLCLDAMSGGWGAFADSDGPGPYRSTTHGDVRDVPVEIQEAMYPYRIESKKLRTNSGGAGKFRGGLGIEKVYRFLQSVTLMNKMDRTRCPPWGLAGGSAAATAGGEVRRASGDVSVLKKGKLEMVAGDVVVISSGGGGGNGPAYERDPLSVLRDVSEGYVSVDAAKSAYGVVLNDDYQIDQQATAARRRAMAAAK